MSFTVKLCISVSIIFSILVLSINPKEGAPIWLVLMEAIAYLVMVAIVVFLTILKFKNKKTHREKMNSLNKEYEKLKEEEIKLKEKIAEKNKA
jgi:phosphotransferase system  glucose/maltose/N-acetylglucosamine-specific IIC component